MKYYTGYTCSPRRVKLLKMRTAKEKLWTVLTTERGQVKAFMNGAPLTSKSGEDYGVLLEVCCTTQSGKRMIQVSLVFRFSHDHSLRTLI